MIGLVARCDGFMAVVTAPCSDSALALAVDVLEAAGADIGNKKMDMMPFHPHEFKAFAFDIRTEVTFRPVPAGEGVLPHLGGSSN